MLILLNAFWDVDSEASIVQSLGWSGHVANFIRQPWTLITHLLMHVSFAHFFLNLLVLYVIGKELELVIGKREWWRTYLLSTLGGVLAYSLSSYLLNHGDRYLVGNSAANMGLVFALVAIDYNRRVNFWGVVILEMKWVAMLFIILDLIGIRQGWNIGGSWAHIGGGLVGWLMWRSMSKLKSGSTIHKRPKTDDEFNSEKVRREQQLNDILDKINRSGYESLSNKEKEFLKEQSMR
jgi:membrane associated rhomboid family serine protease